MCHNHKCGKRPVEMLYYKVTSFLLLAVLTITPAFPSQRTQKVPKPGCAHSAVMQVCHLLGIPVTMTDVTEQMPVDPEGNSLLEIAEALTHFGLQVGAYDAGFAFLKTLVSPAIVHFQDHFAVVERVDRGYVIIFDGAGRRRILTFDEFLDLWSGKLLVIRRPAADGQLPSFLSRALADSPRVCLTTLIQDAGEVVKGMKTLVFEFPLRNVGTKVLQIRRIRTDCKCTVTGDTPDRLNPGEQTCIRIEYRPADRIGPFLHRAFLETNDKLFPVVPLTIAGFINQALFIAPSRLNFGQVEIGTQAHARVIVRQFGDLPLKLAVSSNLPRLRIVAKPLRACRDTYESRTVSRACKYYLVEAWFSANNADLGMAEGVVQLTTGIDKPPVLEIPYVARVVAAVRTVPSTCCFGDLSGEQRAAASVYLLARSQRRFSVVSVNCSDTRVKCNTSSAAPAYSSELHFVAASSRPLSRIDAYATVSYLREGCTQLETIRLPVYGYAPGGDE